MRDKIGLILPTALIILAEIFFFLGDSEMSLSFHCLNIFLCIVLPIFLESEIDLFQAFALVSMLRVLNIGMPIFFSMTIYWLPFIYGPIIIAGYIIWRSGRGGRLSLRNIPKYLNGTSDDVGAKWKGEYALYAILFGYFAANVENWILHNDALIPNLEIPNLIILLLIMTIFVGFGEELVFRGLLQTAAKKRAGMWGAILLSSFAFALMHSGYHNPEYLVFVFAIGFLLGLAYERTQSLGLISLMHGFLNFFLFSLIPFGYGIHF